MEFLLGHEYSMNISVLIILPLFKFHTRVNVLPDFDFCFPLRFFFFFCIIKVKIMSLLMGTIANESEIRYWFCHQFSVDL